MRNIIHYKYGSYLPLTENWIYSQINNLSQYTPIFYSHSTENLDVFPLNKIRSLDKFKLRDKDISVFINKFNQVFGINPAFLFYLKIDQPLLIHAHFGNSGYYFLQLKKKFKIPLITTFYGYDINRLPYEEPKWGERYKILFKEGDLFLVEGNYMKKSLIDMGCKESKIIVQHLGVDLDKIKFVSRKLEVNQDIKILISSSFREKKGIPYAVEAFGIIKKKYPELNIKLTIIGDAGDNFKDKEEKRKILKIIEKFDLENSIHLLGYQPHSVFLHELYKHHIFLHPSIHASDGDSEGGSPVSITEASASGMPIISTMHCDIPEVVLNEKSGFLVPEKDTNSLAEKLEFLIFNYKMWAQMGEIGRKHIEEEYNLKKQIINLENVYGQVLKCI